MYKRIPVNITLPKELVEQVDEIVGPRNRSAFIEEAMRYKICREEMRLAFVAAAGMLDPKDYPEWSTAEGVQAWVHERRREETDVGADADASAA